MSQTSDIYLIFGDDDYLVEQGLGKVLSHIHSQGYDDVTVETVDCKEHGIGDVMAEIASPSLFSTNKATVLKRFQLTGQSKLASQLDALAASPLAPGQFLILMPDKVDKRLRIVKSVKRKGGLLELNAFNHDGLIGWIIERFKEEGKSASRKIAEALVDLKGEDDPEGQTMRALDSEIEKLIVYCGGAKKITQADVEAVVGRSRTEKAFELIGHVALKQAGDALQALGDLLQTGESPIGLVVMLSRTIRQFIHVRLFFAAGDLEWDDELSFAAFRSSVLPAFKAWVEAQGIPPETTFLRQKPFGAYHRFKEASGYNLDDLMSLLERLLEANTLLVSTSVKPHVILERLVTSLGV